jgi:CheY-like chemotaxis protein
MFKLLLVTPNKDALARLASALAEREDVQVSWAESGSQALNIASQTNIALVVTDEKLGDMTGLQLAERLLMLNAVINCAVVSPLSPEDFHRASEGLGLMAQLSPRPGEEEGAALVERLKHIKGVETST